MADPKDCLLVQFSPPGGGEDLTLPAPSDLRFDSEFPGGFKSLSCSLAFPAGTATPAALQPLSAVSVVDRRTGSIVWHGELTDPGLSVGRGGQQFSVTAEGAQLRADGWREVYGLVDRAQESWQAVGDFQGSSSSFSGDLSPDGDYSFDGYNDIIDFGDDLGIDFGDLGGLGIDDFGGDLGDFGSIDFSGSDYPAPADYPGYLGFLDDPFTDVPGDMAAIPTLAAPADGSFWSGWEPGLTASGGSATGTSTGTLTSGTAPPGDVSRRLIGTSGGGMENIGGAMFTPGMYDISSPRFTGALPGSGLAYVTGAVVHFKFLTPDAVLRFMFWSDESLSTGYFVDVAARGALTFTRDGTVLASQIWAPTIGTEYLIQTDGVSPEPNVARSNGLTSGYTGANQPAIGSVVFAPWTVLTTVVEPSNPSLMLAQVSWTLPDFRIPIYGFPGYSHGGNYGVTDKWAEQPLENYTLQNGLYWGIGVIGGGQQSVEVITVDAEGHIY